MYWNIRISSAIDKAFSRPKKERLYIPNTTAADAKIAKTFASNYYGVSEDLILVIPVNQKELD
jgi:hypothetical protein